MFFSPKIVKLGETESKMWLGSLDSDLQSLVLSNNLRSCVQSSGPAR